MANVDRVNGAKVVGTLSGSPWSAALRTYILDTGHSAIYTGDLVQMTSDGYLDVYAASETQLMGVMMGLVPAAPGRTNTIVDHFLASTTPTLHPGGYSAANTADTILVCVAPDSIYEMQEDGDTDPLELADIGQNVEIINGGGSTTTGMSGMELDSSTHNTTNTLPLRLLGLVDRVDNEYVSGGQAYTRWLVTPANHALSGLNVAI